MDPTIVGTGSYRGIKWNISRKDNNNKTCNISVTSIFILQDDHSKQFIANQNVTTKDNKIYTTSFTYKRKEGREIARSLAIAMWSIYDRYGYGIEYEVNPNRFR